MTTVVNMRQTNFPTVLETLVDAQGKSVEIEIRTTDVFVNCTRICRSYGKNWSKFWERGDAKQYATRLEAHLRRSLPWAEGPLQLTESIMVGPNADRRTWADRRIAIRCLCWCNPEFEISADELFLRYISGQVTTEESRAAAAQFAQQVRVVDDTADSPSAIEPPRGSFVSSEVVDKYIHAFYDKQVLYLILFSKDDQEYMKFGFSTNFKDRFKQHINGTFKGHPWQLYFCVASSDAHQLEQNLKAHLLARQVLTTLSVNNSNLSEIVDLSRMSPVELVKVVQEQQETLDSTIKNTMLERMAQDTEVKKYTVDAEYRFKFAELLVKNEKRLEI